MYPVFIYALLDPRTSETRYVGQTPDPDMRLERHIQDSKTRHFHNARWVQSLLSKNLRPVMEILDVVPDAEADFWEREYIQNFRERGFDLTNISDGGNTPMRGKKHTPEARAKIGAASATRKHSLETRAKMSAACRGRKNSPEARAKLSAAMAGRSKSPEHRAALSAAHAGKKHSPEHRQNNSAAQTGKKHSPETRAKMCAAHKKRPRP